jgi:hypothetical protein
MKWRKSDKIQINLNKMKVLVYTFIYLAVFSFCSGQEISLDRSLISNGGTNAASIENYQLDFTIGEFIVGNFQVDGMTINQGFQQQVLLSTGLLESEKLNAEILVYPNPAIDQTSIMVKASGKFQIKIFDMNGRLHLAPLEILGFSEQTLKVDNFQKGVYLIEIMNQHLKRQTVYLLKH